MRISEQLHNLYISRIAKLDMIRQPYFVMWRELADYYLPRRYVWLHNDSTHARVKALKNPHILDSTGTAAARILASGMMNGITSPARPWFSLRLAGNDDINTQYPVRVWLDEVARRMMQVLAESNFYNCLAVMYLDLVVFGTAAMLIYEDYDGVVRCYNCALGEYYLSQDDRLAANGFARQFTYTVEQIVQRWGEENVTDETLNLWKKGGASTQESVTIMHLIEPNYDGITKVPKSFKFRETYWEKNAPKGTVLGQMGFHELPGVFPRWELTANDAYGTSPAMEALGDVIQLQFETKRKAQGIDKMVNPPLLVDVQLQHRPVSAIPGGITHVAGTNNVGAKPLYQIAVPINELSMDIQNISNRIRETFHNPLFQMISQLDTVRSASEIDARQEEKLVLLGPVLERFENEALDPGLTRIFAIMNRANLFPPAPPEIEGMKIDIQYVSILSTAQSAVSAAPTERWIGFIGNIAAIKPEVLNIPDWDAVVRTMGTNLGVPKKLMVDEEASKAATAQQNQDAAANQALAQGGALTGAAQHLSATEVGGGANALQTILGG